MLFKADNSRKEQLMGSNGMLKRKEKSDAQSCPKELSSPILLVAYSSANRSSSLPLTLVCPAAVASDAISITKLLTPSFLRPLTFKNGLLLLHDIRLLKLL